MTSKWTDCTKTVSEEHIWAVMGGEDPRIANLKICVACGLIDDRKKDGAVDKSKAK